MPKPIRLQHFHSASLIKPKKRETFRKKAISLVASDESLAFVTTWAKHRLSLCLVFFLNYSRAKVRLLLSSAPWRRGQRTRIISSATSSVDSARRLIRDSHPQLIFRNCADMKSVRVHLASVILLASVAVVMPGKQAVTRANQPIRLLAQPTRLLASKAMTTVITYRTTIPTCSFTTSCAMTAGAVTACRRLDRRLRRELDIDAILPSKPQR